MILKLDNLSANPSCMVFDSSLNLSEKVENHEFFRDYKLKFINKSSSNSKFETYVSSDEVTQGCGELTVLCGRSLLHGLAKYPYRSKYVLFHLSFFNLFFYIGAVGLIRRLLLGKNNPNAKITFSGILKVGSFIPSYFILYTNPNARTTYHYSVNSQIGYKGFLNYLNKTGKKYIVLRFFENLPLGGRVGGDLDILVEDDLEKEASDFLMQNPGTEMVDMYSVSGPSDAARIPYYTPFLSRKMLEDSIDFNGYRVPNNEDYLNSFIYHCLYHKGLSSGIPTCYSDLKISNNPDNDYMLKIKNLSSVLGVLPGETLEELDEYMHECGWKPHDDTLELLSNSNKWIRRHLKEQKLEEEITLIICVLKEGFHNHHTIESFKSSLDDYGFSILNYDHLNTEDKRLAYDHLRGGNWSSSGAAEFSPSDIFVLFDSSEDGFLARRSGLAYDPRYKKLAIRKKFDVGHQSHIHMTDSTNQSVQYINVMYKDSLDEYKSKIKNYDEKFSKKVNVFKYIRFFLRSSPYRAKEAFMNFFKDRI